MNGKDGHVIPAGSLLTRPTPFLWAPGESAHHEWRAQWRQATPLTAVRSQRESKLSQERSSLPGHDASDPPPPATPDIPTLNTPVIPLKFRWCGSLTAPTIQYFKH